MRRMRRVMDNKGRILLPIDIREQWGHTTKLEICFTGTGFYIKPYVEGNTRLGIISVLDKDRYVCLPMEGLLELGLDLNRRNDMSITMTEDGINIAPYKRLCVVCQQEGELVNIYYKYVCVKCIQKLVVSLASHKEV